MLHDVHVTALCMLGWMDEDNAYFFLVRQLIGCMINGVFFSRAFVKTDAYSYFVKRNKRFDYQMSVSKIHTFFFPHFQSLFLHPSN
jgi:hypothetical protein